jgi:predicted aspartyl protease
MRLGFLTIGTSALLWAFPALAEEPRTLPIQMSDSGHILTDVLIDGEGPYTFIVDTAAGSTVVFDDFAAEAGLEDVTGDAVIRVQGASGAIEARLVRVGELSAGNWRYVLDRAVSLPAPPHITDADGVLGANILLSQPVGFALGEGELLLYGEGARLSAEQLPPGDWIAVPIEQRLAQAPFYWMTIVVDGVAMDAVIDTGARRTTINPAGARALGIDPDTAALVEAEPIRGATADETPAWGLPVATVQLGERVWSSRHLTLSDLPIFARMGRADLPTVVFGADFLAEQNFIVDPVEGVLWLKKRQSAALGLLVRPTTELSSAIR